MATTTKKTTTKAKTKTTAKAKKPAVKKSEIKETKTNVKATSKSTTSKVEKPTKTSSTKQPKSQMEKLRTWNFVLAFLHFIQGVAVIILSTDALFPVTTTYLTTDALASTEQAPVLVNATRNLFDVNLAYVVAAFFFMSAIAHLSLATWYRKKYEENLPKGLNKARWYEYGISASTMMLAIAMLSGVADLSTLVMIFGATLVMNLCGLIKKGYFSINLKSQYIDPLMK